MKYLILIAVMAVTVSAEYDVYRKNKYGLEEKYGTYKKDYKGDDVYYEKGKYGIQEKKREDRTEWDGSTGIYEKNRYGLWVKVGSIK